MLAKFRANDSLTVHQRATTELTKVNEWLVRNKIKININKSKFIIFNYRGRATFPSLLLGDGHVEEADQIKFLGLTIDRHLNFNDHIDSIKSRIARTTGIIFKLNKFLPDYILRSIYQSLITPVLNYGIEAWHSAPKYQTDKVYLSSEKSCSSNM